MEALLANVRRSVELLAVSGTASVADWREPEARRALSWSRYCHHIHHRFHSHPAICSALEETLRDSNRRLRDNFEGYEDLTLLDLAHCQDLLVGRLLHNPVTPARILRMLFEPPLQGDLDTTEEDASGHCLRVLQYKSACKVLSATVSSGAPSPVSARWSSGGAEDQEVGLSAWWSSGGAEVQGGGLSALWFSGGAEVQVQGEMLMERLEALLHNGAEQSGCPAGMKAQRFLDSTLAAPPPTCHVCLVVTAALLQTRRKDAAEEFLLKWLQRNEDVMQQVCTTLSSGCLAALLQRHQENFGIPYVDLLKNRASRMTYDLHQARWVPESFQTDLGVTQNFQTDLGGVSFQTLTQSFRVLLLEAGPSVRASVLEDLNHLKVSDGDFDVKGLSVWSDLLMELKA